MSPRLALTAVLLTVIAVGSASSGAQQPPAAAPYPLDDVPDKMPFDVPYGAPVPLERAQAAIAAAAAEARKHDWKLCIAVVDSGGNLVAFQRMDGAQLASVKIAEHKAKLLAARGRRPQAMSPHSIRRFRRPGWLASQ